MQCNNLYRKSSEVIVILRNLWRKMRRNVGIICICSSILELISSFSTGRSNIIWRTLNSLLRYLSLVPIQVNGLLSSWRCILLEILLLLLLLVIVCILLLYNHWSIILKLSWIFSVKSINFLLLPLLSRLLIMLKMLLMLLLIEMKLRVITVVIVTAIQNSISLFSECRCLLRLNNRLILRISKLLVIVIISLIILR